MSTAPAIEHDIHAVLFDVDDTWMPSRKMAPHHLETIARRNGFAFHPGKIDKHWGKPGRIIVRHVFGLSSQRSANRHYPKWGQIEQEFPPRLFRGTRRAFQRLRQENLPLGIVTNRGTESLGRLLTRKRLAPFFDQRLIRGAEEGRPAKPNPLVFDDALAVLEPMGVKPPNIAYIGDGDKDVRAALGAGLTAILVETGDHETVTVEPHARFPTVAHAGDWIVGHRARLRA